jgi:hypothetical protein
MTIAAVIMGLVHILGGMTPIVAMSLGTIALLGLVVHTFGFEVPPFLVLGWWVLLAMYVVLGLAGEIQHALGG